MMRLKRNTPCPCGSNLKYKHCCRLTQDPMEPPHELRPGTRIQCVIDWYRVLDRKGLISLLEGLPEVVGCTERGWSRIDPESRYFAPMAALVFGQDGQIEVTTATEFAAETTRWWLERIAGELVSHECGTVWGQEIDRDVAPTASAQRFPRHRLVSD